LREERGHNSAHIIFSNKQIERDKEDILAIIRQTKISVYHIQILEIVPIIIKFDENVALYISA
jgi:hypothetical protein